MKLICTAALTIAMLSGTVVYAQATSTDTNNTMAGSNSKSHHKKKHKKASTGSDTAAGTSTTK
jgi:cell division protein FtsL